MFLFLLITGMVLVTVHAIALSRGNGRDGAAGFAPAPELEDAR